jgi:uncharacterized protein YciI
MCLESTELHHVQDVLRHDPIIRMLLLGENDDSSTTTTISETNNDHSNDDHESQLAPLDISCILRIDDGRDGYPCLCIAFDEDRTKTEDGSMHVAAIQEKQQLRKNLQSEYLETLIRSERVIAAGPLHVATVLKDDPASIALGDFILFNAKDRDDAISFCENLPTALHGLYDSMRVHFYNTLDITGKFVSEDPLRDAPCEQMKEAMEYWGYPVSDEQTPWINR